MHVNPLQAGIKLIGIGKHGSKKIPDELIAEIVDELLTGQAKPLQVGAFFGALLMKPLEPSYYLLELYLGQGVLSDPQLLFERICPEIKGELRTIGISLLQGQTLNLPQAETLGQFMFGNMPGETFRGMAASILRIRYETEIEYEGLYKAIQQTYLPGFAQVARSPRTIVQLAEPFDGVEHSYMLTPLLAKTLQAEGYTVVSLVGRSGGPKFTLNAADVFDALGAPCLTKAESLHSTSKPNWGHVLHQQNLSAALDNWVDKRKFLTKRPFLATLEKVLNPLGAQVLVTSVFHITYVDVMINLGLMAGFDGIIVMKRGLEGTLAPSIAKASGIVCAARQANGGLLTHNIDASDPEFETYRGTKDEEVPAITAEKNAALIKAFTLSGSTGDLDFDNRAQLGMALLKAGSNWLSQNMWVQA